MHFDPGEVGECEHLFHQFVDIGEMGEKALGVLVGFAAENLVAIECEVVVQDFDFRSGLFDELPEQRLNGGEFSGVSFEVGMEADHGF